MMTKGILAFLCFLFCTSVGAQSTLDSLLTVLDRAVAGSDRYEDVKKQRIALIKEGLASRDLSLEEEYRINSKLFGEYEAYICDSARHYITKT